MFLPFIGTLLVGYAFPIYDPVADRRRFPPDAVLKQWHANNRAYADFLKTRRAEIKNSVSLYSARPEVQDVIIYEVLPALNAELAETDRIGAAIWMLALPSSEGLSPDTLKAWVFQARTLYLTPVEYAAGYIPYGGLPGH